MQTEYEAKFLNVDKDRVRALLKEKGAVMEKPEAMLKRWVFDLPKEKNSSEKYLRVRDEWGTIVMTWKEFTTGGVDNSKEIELVVDSFDNAIEFLDQLGCVRRSYQESTRELWHLDDVEIAIDTWPFHDPFIEIEGASEEAVRNGAATLGFEWDKALFCGVGKLFRMKYGPDTDLTSIPKITFDMENPFV